MSFASETVSRPARETGTFRYAQTNVQLYDQLFEADHSTAQLETLARAHDLAVSLLYSLFRPEGEPFVTHLIGTASILVRYRAPFPVVLAGLLHAAYDFGEFGGLRRGITPARRRRVRAIVGDEAETVIYRYTRFAWNSQVMESLPRLLPGMSENDRNIVLMRLANELEEGMGVSLLYCHPETRRQRVDNLALCIPVAEAMGLPDLAAELKESHRRNASDGPRERPQLGRSHVYGLAPLSRLGLAISYCVRSLMLALAPGPLREKLRSFFRAGQSVKPD